MIFIVGNSRSGTTMLSRCLGNHSKIYRFKELHYYEGIISNTEKHISKKNAKIILSKLLWKEREEFLSKINIHKYNDEASELLINSPNSINPHELFKLFLNHVTKEAGKEIVCEQTPRNLYFSKELLNYFSNALIINMVRDPRATLLSQKNKWRINKFSGFNVPILNSLRLYFNYHPYTVSRIWKSGIKQSIQLEDDPRFITIKFEDFLVKPVYYLKLICSHFQIKFEDKMLEIGIAGSSFKEDYNKVGFDKTKIDQWRNSGLTKPEIYICQKVTSEELNYLGYKKLDLKINKLHLFLIFLFLPVKIVIALVLNLSRNKNIIKTFKKRFLVN